MPSTLESGGSLVYIKNEGNKKTIEWVGSLLDCQVPEAVVYGESEDSRKRTKNASFPSFSGSSINDFGIAVNLIYKGVGINADAKAFKKTIMTVDEAGHETVQRLAIAYYLADPLRRRKMKKHCVDAIAQHKVAVLVDVAYVEKGKFELYTDNGLTVKVKGSEVIEALDLDASARAKVKNDGTMTINERIYVAFKAAYYIPESGTLSNGTSKLQDATKDLKTIANDL